MPTTVKKPPLTHFLLIPLLTASSTPSIKASLDVLTAETAEPILDHDDRSAQQPPTATTATGVEASTAMSSISARDHTRTRRTIIPTKAIRPLHSLHLTLAVMSLRNEARISEATDLLRALDLARILRQSRDSASTPALSTEEVSDGRAMPLRLQLTSLHPMQSPSSTSSLYLQPVDGTNRLQPFCETLRGAFMERGFVADEDRPLKLHATVVNTLHARVKNKSGETRLGGGKGRGSRVVAARADGEEGARGNGIRDAAKEEIEQTEVDGSNADKDVEEERNLEPIRMTRNGKIDARQLIERWKDTVWAEVDVERVAICEMGAKMQEDGKVRYKEIAFASFV